MMRSVLWGVVIATSAISFVRADPPLVLDVWPGKPPGETKEIGPERVLEPKEGEKSPTKRVMDVSKPTITVYRPAANRNTGTTVLIAPGGGYNILAFDKEGEEVAEWLNTLGVTGVVLKYRVPRRADQPKDKPPLGALQDAQRALSLIRTKADDWKLDKKKIGMLGFSAGGHLTAWTTTNFDQRGYTKLDAVDEESCRPDFAVLIYPAYLALKGTTDLQPEIRVSKDTPPTFFAHAGDDPVAPENSIAMYLACKKLGVPTELHIYASGGHGFGLRPSTHAASTWPARCADWLKSHDWIK